MQQLPPKDPNAGKRPPMAEGDYDWIVDSAVHGTTKKGNPCLIVALACITEGAYKDRVQKVWINDDETQAELCAACGVSLDRPETDLKDKMLTATALGVKDPYDFQNFVDFRPRQNAPAPAVRKSAPAKPATREYKPINPPAQSAALPLDPTGPDDNSVPF